MFIFEFYLLLIPSPLCANEFEIIAVPSLFVTFELNENNTPFIEIVSSIAENNIPPRKKRFFFTLQLILIINYRTFF